MKIKVYCEVSVIWTDDSREWILQGHIAAPCLPDVESDFWFMEDIDVGPNPAKVLGRDVFREIKPGVFEPEIRLEWVIGCNDIGETSEEGLTHFKEKVLPKLVERGWKISPEKP